MFFQSCQEYFSGRLVNFLQSCVNAELSRSNNEKIIYIVTRESPDIVCSVDKVEENIFEITLSTLFLHRLAILAKCREMAWLTFNDRERLFTFDHDHPYDSHVWDYVRDDTYPFGVQTAFRDYLSLNYGYKSVEQFVDFVDRFNSKKENGFHYLDFKLSNHLEESVKDLIKVFSTFLIFHEYTHIISPHAMFLQNWPYKKIPRRSSLAGTIYRYRHKAIEIDADIRGMYLSFMSEFGENPSLRNIQYYFTCIACGFALFDLDRRNTLDTKSIDGLYPLPEIRFDAMIFGLTRWNNALKKVRDAVMIDIVRSVQMLGIFAGPFYLYSGPLTSLDRQFTKEVQILESVRSELKKIIIQLNEYYGQITNPLPKIGDDWRIDPVGMDEQEFKKVFAEEMVGVFEGKYNNVSEDELVQERALELRKLRESGLVRKGDHLLIATDQTKELRPETKIHLNTKNEEKHAPSK